MEVSNSRVFAAEVVGTAVLMLGGPGSAILAGDRIGTLGIALGFGFSLLVMAYAIGHVTGLQHQPRRHPGHGPDPQADGPKPPSTGWGSSSARRSAVSSSTPSPTTSRASAARTTSPPTAGTSTAPAATGSWRRCSWRSCSRPCWCTSCWPRRAATSRSGFGGLAAGITLALIHMVTIPVDNTSVNPARSFGSALFAGPDALAQLWLFIVFPLIGAAVGAHLDHARRGPARGHAVRRGAGRDRGARHRREAGRQARRHHRRRRPERRGAEAATRPCEGPSA